MDDRILIALEMCDLLTHCIFGHEFIYYGS